MNRRQILIVLVALVVALGAIFWLRATSPANQNADAAKKIESAESMTAAQFRVLVAARDISVGERIAAGTIAWQAWPPESVKPNFITAANTQNAMTLFNNAIVKTPISSGEPITRAKLAPADPSAGVMAALLSPGMLAITVRANQDTASAGFVLPGSHIDVIYTKNVNIKGLVEADGSEGEEKSVPTSDIILKNIKVLAVNQSTIANKDQKTFEVKSITLELKPSEAELIKTAESDGKLTIALRSYADFNDSRGQAPTSMIEDLSPNRAKSSAVNGTKSVKVYKGGS